MRNRLFISCAGRKLGQFARAIDLYQARQFNLAKELRELNWQITIISAKYGLVDADQVIATYDQKMTLARSNEILSDDFPDISGTTNYVYGGELYRRIVRELDQNVVEIIGRNRGNGDHYSHLAGIVAEQKAPNRIQIGL